MPERKGRRRRRRDRREHATDEPGAASVSAARAAAPAKPAPVAGLPSRNARLSGLAIAILTGVLAAMLFYGAFSGERSTGEMITRAFLGAAMIGLAVFVGVLVLFPAQLRDYFQRRRQR